MQCRVVNENKYVPICPPPPPPIGEHASGKIRAKRGKNSDLSGEVGQKCEKDANAHK